MNVLALVTDAFGGFGGIAQYNRDLLCALGHGGNRIVVLPRHGSPDPASLPAGIAQLTPRKSAFAYSLAALYAAMTHGPHDVVFCGHLYMAPLGAAIARILGVPLWLQLHGREAWAPVARSRRWAAERASVVTAVSRYTRRRFLSWTRLDPSRVRVLPNTVSASFAPGPKPAYLIERHTLRGRKVLLTVGRLAHDERGKGHDVVIRALPKIMAACPDVVYLIAGQGDDQIRLEDLARDLGVADQVRFVGMAKPEELADYYRAADVFVMPSVQEGFGIVFLEAAACALPVIGGNRDGSIDALGDGAIGVAIDPGDPDALVGSVIKALSGPAPDPNSVQRFAFENFATQIGALTHSHLLRPTACTAS
jgi:phosphatidylinositol alpha-1,6-mannosyltransferase